MNPELTTILKDHAAPRWLREIHEYLGVKAQFVLHGNIRDQMAFGTNGAYELYTLTETLMESLTLRGYAHFFTVDPIHGISITAPPSTSDPAAHVEATLAWLKGTLPRVLQRLQLDFTPERDGSVLRAQAPFGDAVEFTEHLALSSGDRCAVIFDYLMGNTDGNQSREPFIRSLIASYEARPTDVFNAVFWLTDRENDLPPWFALANPRIRACTVSKPDKRIRETVGEALLTALPGFESFDAPQREKAIKDFAAQTDGMALYDMQLIVRFALDKNLAATHIAEAARSYKLGITEDPWKTRMNKQTLFDAEANARKRVRGQDAAIIKTIDSVRRALRGLSGAQSGVTSPRPKGVLFFAGPTGVGKTELAKSLTEGLFGDEHAYIRFDMSEFNHEHADQRLIGAPPGYVGFEAGGELTDAIRERPCSVVLFDEIEKAHGKILDKFLQILDDGQLTSGKGERVYFSDALIIFTSNLGIDENITSDLNYEQLESRVRAGVEHHFKKVLGRPELLNRIGDNIIVFDFVRPEIAAEILDKMLANVIARVKESQSYTLDIDPAVRSALLAQATKDLSNGGRGIGNILETAFVNPLARKLDELELSKNDTITVTGLHFDTGNPVLEAVRRS